MYQIGVVVGEFHRNEADIMLRTVQNYAVANELKIVEEVWVPGSMEKPLALKHLLMRNDIDGALTLGIIEKGETQHGLVMAQAVIGAIINLQLEFMKPIGVGILGPDIQPSQIPSRIESYALKAIEALHSQLSV
jgi:6,7-dimethyl-8-ribityllumazine synthase